MKSGDEEVLPRAEAALKLAVKAGDMTQDKMNSYVDRFPGVLQENQIRNGIVHNAVATRDGIDDGKYPDVPPTSRDALRKEAEAKINKDQIASYKDIRRQQSEGKLFTRKELNDMADAEKISGTSIDEILKAQKGEIGEQDNAVAASKVHDAILDIPTNATPVQRLDAVVKIHGSKDYQSLTEQQKKDFDGALKPEKEPGNPIHRTQMEMMKKAFEDREKQSEMAPADYRAKYGHKLKQPNEESERIRYARAQQSYVDWTKTKKGAEATPDEASAERERLGFGEYHTAEDVKAALKAGKIERSMAKQILAGQFGIE